MPNMSYSTLVRRISEIFKNMGEIPFVDVPKEEMNEYQNAYDSIQLLLNTTKIPHNIPDR